MIDSFATKSFSLFVGKNLKYETTYGKIKKMGAFFAYIIKSTICLTLFYLFYRLLLSRDTFHRFNRIALLSLIGLSVVIPFIRISTDKATAIQSPMLNLEEFLLISGQAPVPSSQSVWLQIAMLVYLGGILLFTLRLLYSGWMIIRMIRSGERVDTGLPVTLIITDRDIAPFSWMNHIVISRKDWEESREEILAHEMAHIRSCHSWDVLLSGVCVVFHWFNPASWLLKQELQSIHEYEADESVLNQGIDAKRYQLLLIKKAVGTQRFTSMANSFNHSKLKKRITMMLKSKSNTWGRLKYLYVLPLAAITIAAFARPEISHELDKISSTIIGELPQEKDNKQKEFADFFREIPENSLYFIDDVKATRAEMEAIAHEDIKHIRVLKDAWAFYGENVETVVYFTTKKGDAERKTQ